MFPVFSTICRPRSSIKQLVSQLNLILFVILFPPSSKVIKSVDLRVKKTEDIHGEKNLLSIALLAEQEFGSTIVKMLKDFSGSFNSVLSKMFKNVSCTLTLTTSHIFI